MCSASELIAAALVRNGMERNILRLETKAGQIYYDALTGIYNRRFLDENLQRTLGSVARAGGVLSLLMVDIDHFKKYNDTYGHSEGDYCLRVVAQTLRGCTTRADDYVVRYGGEEFAVVLRDTNKDGAAVVAGKILDNIRKLNIPHAASDVADCVTVSIGGTCGKVAHTQDGEDYIRCADEMLYQAKQTGRNRYLYAPMQSCAQHAYKPPVNASNLGNALAGITMMPVLSDGNLPSAAQVICEVGAHALNVHRVGVWLMSPDEKRLQSLAYFSLATGKCSVQDDFDISARAQYMGLLKTRRVLAVPDMRQKTPLSDIAQEYGPQICALLDAPVRVRGKLAGVVCIEQDSCEKYPEKREWTIEEQNFASSLADMMALAIASAGVNDDRASARVQ